MSTGEEIVKQEIALDFKKKLSDEEKDLVSKIVSSPTKQDLEDQLNLFAMAQAKKGALRINRLNELIDMVEMQALKRFQNKPDQISNKELLDYLNIVSTQIEKISDSISSINEIKNEVKVLNQKNEVNINMGPELDKASKERVMDAVALLLKQAGASSQNSAADEPVDPISVEEYDNPNNSEVEENDR